MVSRSIANLNALVAALPPVSRQLFNRIFSVDITQGRLKIPPPLSPWVEQQFGSVDNVSCQPVVKITNLITLENSIFNPLRELRPRHFRRRDAAPATGLHEAPDDQFAAPLKYTTEDIFGRVSGKHCITASNIARYEGWHSVIIFQNSDPLAFGYDEIADYIDTGWRWAQQAHACDPDARYFLLLWNCMSRAGASISHGHAQVVLGRKAHYGKVEQLRKAAAEYREKYGSSYFDDLFHVHRALGLGWQQGDTRILAYLAAIKLNEIMVVSPALTDSLKQGIYHALSCFRDGLGVRAFNLGIAFPPLNNNAGWEDFPVMARMVDRGDPGDLSSDIGAMEFYGANIVTSDPFRTADMLSSYIAGGR